MHVYKELDLRINWTGLKCYEYLFNPRRSFRTKSVKFPEIIFIQMWGKKSVHNVQKPHLTIRFTILDTYNMCVYIKWETCIYIPLYIAAKQTIYNYLNSPSWKRRYSFLALLYYSFNTPDVPHGIIYIITKKFITIWDLAYDTRRWVIVFFFLHISEKKVVKRPVRSSADQAGSHSKL